MTDLRWYRWNIRKYRDSDRVLLLSGLAAHGAYRNLLDAYMEKGRLPTDRRALWKLAMAPSQAEYELVADEVEAMFIVSDCGKFLLHDTADGERRDAVQKMEATSEVRSIAGSKGAAKRWQKDGKSIAHNTIAHNTTEPKSKTASATRLPHDFKVTPEHRYWALERGLPSPDDHIEHFREFWLSNGKKKLDWNATFRVWLINSKTKYGATNGRKAQTQQDQQRDELRSLCAVAGSVDGGGDLATTVPKLRLLPHQRSEAISTEALDQEGGGDGAS